MYASNKTFEERLRLGEIPEQAAKFMDEVLDKISSLEKDLEYFKKREEVLDEQVYFAKEVIGNIQYGVEQAHSIKQARHAVVMAIENGFFEL